MITCVFTKTHARTKHSVSLLPACINALVRQDGLDSSVMLVSVAILFTPEGVWEGELPYMQAGMVVVPFKV